MSNLRASDTISYGPIDLVLYTGEIVDTDDAVAIVQINIEGSYWDHKYFYSMEEAQAFMADPFKGERQAAERQAACAAKADLASAPYYARDYVRISTGRQIGPNKR